MYGVNSFEFPVAQWCSIWTSNQKVIDLTLGRTWELFFFMSCLCHCLKNQHPRKTDIILEGNVMFPTGLKSLKTSRDINVNTHLGKFVIKFPAQSASFFCNFLIYIKAKGSSYDNFYKIEKNRHLPKWENDLQIKTACQLKGKYMVPWLKEQNSRRICTSLVFPKISRPISCYIIIH